MPAVMDDANGSVSRDIKDENNDTDDAMDEGKSTYKSYKKKYRKMRIKFDQKMHDCEDLHHQEAKAFATAKRIAIENDRILDLLMDMNSSAQIPLDKRVDLSMTTPSDLSYPPLDADAAADADEIPAEDRPTKSLKTLVREVPHLGFSQAKDHSPSVVADMEPFAGEPHPPSFLTSDDIDDYLHDIDRRLHSDDLLPTLAPSARTGNSSLPETNPHYLSQTIAVKNPTSVYNWLRKHAPKTFLQDAENTATAGAGDEDTLEAPPTDGRRRRGGARGGGGEGSRGGRGSRGGKRASLAASRAEKAAERAAEKAALAAERAAAMREAADNWEAMQEDEDDDMAVSTPATGRGKRKRASTRGGDDDDGYRPKGSTSRPTKKKRKSEADGTPTVSKRGRKSEPRDRDD
ncbi:INO80 complex subunit 3 [Colletotrichum trifolii]|uniref:INO80 complex subunit 3 n=1 Tax=Colletotrichum trifolii TaxID=5466 RepID=A0A4R8RBX5_COLTR|nr:INO80 complex subunit 3 [Colletotrichum trifolii]